MQLQKENKQKKKRTYFTPVLLTDLLSRFRVLLSLLGVSVLSETIFKGGSMTESSMGMVPGWLSAEIRPQSLIFSFHNCYPEQCMDSSKMLSDLIERTKVSKH